MSSDGSFSCWVGMLTGAMIGVFIVEPKSRKLILGVFLLLGIVWLMGGALFGFETTEAAMVEATKFVFGAFLLISQKYRRHLDAGRMNGRVLDHVEFA
jgi:hypothetical protein